MKRYSLLLVLPLLLAGCNATEDSRTAHGTLSIATWNVQALFDGEESGYEYEDYRRSTGWTDEKYQARLNTLGAAIKRMATRTPDIIALIEIENIHALADLIQGPLAKEGYQYAYFGAYPNRGLGLGIISRYPFEESISHSFTAKGESSPRPMLEVRVCVEGHSVVLLACHWKSKVDGAEASEAKRKSSARLALRRLRELHSERIPVILMGDLNENYDEFVRIGQSNVCALMPDDPAAAAITADVQMDFLILSREKPPLASAFPALDPEPVALYTPWDNELIGGSYNYRNAWESIDHFLLSSALFDDADWEFASYAVLTNAPFIKANGKPYTYDADTGNGLSDHLPLLLTLKRNQ